MPPCSISTSPCATASIPDAVGYTTTQYANALVLRGSGSSSAYYLTANPYGQAAEFLADRTAISSTSGMQLYGAYASLIRNAGGDLNAVISNAETGEVYASVDQGVQFALTTTRAQRPGATT